MQILFSEKQLIFSAEDFTHPHNAAKALNRLVSVMLYPDDETSQHLFLVGEKAMILDEHPDEKDNFIKDKPQVGAELYLCDLSKAKRVVTRSMHSRQGGGKGGLYMRGLVTGTLLQYLRIEGTLKGAYELYLKYPQSYTRESGEVEPIAPSASTLRKIWDYFLPVAPLWASWAAFQENFQCVPSTVPKQILPQVMSDFVDSATSWRRFLVEIQDASCPGTYLIEEPSRIWSILYNTKSIS